MSNKNDSERLRALAGRWMEIASLPIMQQRKKAWRSIKDLNAIRPAILIETATIKNFVTEQDLLCVDPFLRNVEKNMLMNIWQFEEVGDDIVLEPYFHIGWQLDFSDYGVKIRMESAEDMDGGHYGYKVKSPIETLNDLNKLRPRTITLNKNRSLEYQSILNGIFGDILPVRLRNACIYEDQPGYSPHLGVNFLYVTYEMQVLLGNEQFLLWPYDHPEALHQMGKFLLDDKINLYRWMEQQEIIAPNTDNHWAGPGSYGYCSKLPSPDKQTSTKISDCWGRSESQESGSISPEMFNEVYLPYIAQGCRMFGLVYYGCCERLDDRWEYIQSAIPNLRAICVSPWNDIYKMGEYLGKDYVYSGKTNPAYLSVENTSWDTIEKELTQIHDAAKDCNFELIVRDLYTLAGGKNKLKKWVDLARRVLEIA